MISTRDYGGDQTWGAAWSAHFLADMFVPYHVVGMPAAEVEVLNDRGQWVLSEETCGNWEIMYAPGRYPPRGWGWEHDHSANIRRFCATFWPGNPARVDWFDPWYWNGFWSGFQISEYATGSHAFWELRASMKAENDFFTEQSRLRFESSNDPLWTNAKLAFQDP